MTAGPSGSEQPGAAGRLTVLVRSGCMACRRSERLAAELRVLRPCVDVVVLNVDVETVLPATLVGTPMWLHDGVVRWLGNPSLHEVIDVLDAAAGPGCDLEAVGAAAGGPGD